MSLLGQIDTVPLYSTIEEAETWGSQYNLTGYHTHFFEGNLGYMGGDSHVAITSAVLNGIQNFLSQQVLSQGQFIVTDQERNAYINNIPITQSQPQTLIQPQTQVIIPPVQTVVAEETIDSEEQIVQAPQPFVSTRSVSSGGSSGSGGY
tara:strand:- start:147 stop:593 length:447 start_codon:yes stop_codon:yes gene_type:complete